MLDKILIFSGPFIGFYFGFYMARYAFLFPIKNTDTEYSRKQIFTKSLAKPKNHKKNVPKAFSDEELWAIEQEKK